MFYARRGNQISRIEEHQIAALLEQGFDIVDEKGSVLYEAVPTDLTVLKKAFVENRKRIAELEAEVDTLKKSVTKKTAPKAEKTEEKVETAEEKVEEPKEVTKPKRGAKSK